MALVSAHELSRTLGDEGRRLLVTRLRAGLGMCLCSLAAFAVLLFPFAPAGDRGWLLVVHALELAAIAGGLVVLRRPLGFAAATAVGVAALGIVCIGMALGGVVQRDVDTPATLSIVLLMSTATLVPWGRRVQCVVAAVASACMLSEAVVVGGPTGFWRPAVVALVVGAVASVWVAHETERAQREGARRQVLGYRLAVESLVRGISTRFVNLSAADVDAGIEAALHRLGEFAGADRAYVFRLSADGRACSNVFEWCAEGIPSQRHLLQDVAVDAVPAMMARLRRFEPVHIPDVSALPAAAPERTGLEAHGVRSLLAVPMVFDHALAGFLGFDAVRAARSWSDDAIALLALVGDIFVGALARKHAEEAAAAARRHAEEEARISEALARVGRELIALVETPAVARQIDRLCRELLGSDTGRTLLRDAKRNDYVFAPDAADDRRLLALPAARVAPLLEALGDASFVQRTPAADAAGTLALGLPAELGLAPASGLVACLALRRGPETIGLHVMTLPGRTTPLDARETQIVRGIAQMASLALANAQLVEALAEANRFKSEFVSTMSHELRTPINVILGYADMVVDPAFEAPDRELIVTRVKLAAGDLLDLVEQTLDIGRIESGRDEVRLETVFLVDEWSRLAGRCGRIPRRPSVGLQWDAAADGVRIVTDPRKLGVVVQNLVGNALKFTREGVVRVSVEVEGKDLVLRVADTGVGISAQDQQVIFDMFRQADGSDTRHFGGTGLGLYIVRRYARQLGGDVSLESTPGTGSTFTVRLPLVPPLAVANAA